MKKPKNEFLVYRDSNSRTCIKLIDDGKSVLFIPMEIENGFDIQKCSVEFFNDRYKVMNKYPVDKACALYLGYCKILGASEEVMKYLSQAVKVTKEDIEMAVTKKKSRVKSKEAPDSNEPKAKVKAKAKAKAKKSPAEKVKKEPKKRVSSSSGEYKSAAAMFKELIMEGKFTDDEIFQQVQQEFGLDDNKRSYVKWYRNKLTKEGQNPPEPK